MGNQINKLLSKFKILFVKNKTRIINSIKFSSPIILAIVLLSFISLKLLNNFITAKEETPIKNLSTINWTFGRTDGSIISEKIIFKRDGKIKYSPSYNEVFWKIENGALTLMNGAKQATTVFDKIYKKDGFWVMEGKFLFDKNITHKIIETERSDKKFYFLIITVCILSLSALLHFSGLLKTDKANIFTQTLFLSIFTATLFIYSVDIRTPFNNRTNEWLTGASIKFTNMWIRENPFKLGFGMFFNPDSIEFKDLKSREVYSSYPPGVIIPLYFLGLVKGEVDSNIIMIFNLLNQFLISLTLGLIIFFFLIRINFDYFKSFLLSIIPVTFYLLSPVTLYFHHIVYFSDMAIILPFVLYVLLEVVKDFDNKVLNKIADILSPIVLFYGVFTDYFFVFVALAVYIKKLIFFEFGRNIVTIVKKSFFFALPAIAAALIFIIQVFALGGVKRLVDIFMFRTGLDKNEAADAFFDKFWLGHFKAGYSEILLYLFWFSISIFAAISAYYFAIFLIRKKSVPVNLKKILSLIWIITAPCILQVYFLKNHSTIHFFSILKFAIPIGTVSLLLIWIAIYISVKNDVFNSQKSEFKLFYPLFAVYFIFFSIYIEANYGKFRRFYPPYRDFKLEKFVKNNCDYKDVVFSTFAVINPDPPQYLAAAEKRIYKINSLAEIRNKVEKIDKEYVVNLLIKTDKPPPPDLQYLCDKSENVLQYDEFALYKIFKKTFLDLNDQYVPQ
ncbi:MAG TPA: hypothetical protein PLG34_01270 [Spirochaetota bacterium]|jgi:hypothetical protein|nr:MAG: hypothetical protein BWX91_00773 [Spirochaetes bacterium ADurb.Bin133]HPY86597.1 hypothetical protein [Spirochaetota bacterium]HQB60225.1 hypothetical protein [Spirochaetota bacterium]